MGRLLSFIFLLFIFIIGVSFAVLNQDPVVIDYYYGELAVPLSLVLVLSVALGAILGMLASLGLVVRAKAQAAKLRHTVDVTEKELSNLRAIPLKDNR